VPLVRELVAHQMGSLLIVFNVMKIIQECILEDALE
jgi:hypothetical protein